MRSIAATAVVCLLCAGRIGGAALPTLDEYAAIYEREVAKIEAQYREVIEAALAGYADSFGPIIEALKEQGDLQGYEATAKEQDRFTAEQAVPDAPPPGLPDALVQAQAAYRKRVQWAAWARALAVRRLIDMYTPKLDALKKAVMAEDRIDEAKRVQAELDRVRAVAAAAASIPGPAPEPDPAPAPEPEPAGRRQLPVRLRKGLVVYYDFDEDEGGQVTDRSGKGNHGKVEGAGWTEKGVGARRTSRGWVGGACEFAGKGESVRVPYRPEAGDSVAGWVRLDRTSAMDVWGDEGWSRGGGLVVMSDEFCTLACDGSARRQSTGVRGTAGRWHHVVQVFGRSDTQTYIDGALKDTFRSVLAQQQIEAFRLGKASAGAFHEGAFAGRIDEFMIWRRALSAEEVRQLYEATKGD